MQKVASSLKFTVINFKKVIKHANLKTGFFLNLIRQKEIAESNKPVKTQKKSKLTK